MISKLNEFKIYAEIAKEEDKLLTLDELAEKCRNTCNRHWVKVSLSNKNTYPGEVRKEIRDENGTLKEIWMYRPDDNYDSHLLSLIWCKLERRICQVYHKYKNQVNEDDFLDCVKDFINRSIRHFDSTKSSFTTLVYSMIELGTLNLVRNTTKVASLDAIMEDKRDYCVPTTPDLNETCFISTLKSKYKSKADLMTWTLLDLADDNSQLLQLKGLSSITCKMRGVSLYTFKQVINYILNNELHIKLGFPKFKGQEFVIKTENRVTISHLTSYYKNSLDKIREELIA